MGGASSFYAMLFISIFLFAVWTSGQISRKIGVSSIVLEVSTGLILGPSLLNLIPAELSECFDYRNIKCDERPHQVAIAEKGTEFCDLQAYLDADMYAPGRNWTDGFWGANVNFVVLHDHQYSLDGDDHHRRLAGGNEGKTSFGTYDECLREGCKLDLALRCATTPDIFSLTGHTGVAMMIFESGMHFDFEQASTVGPWACAVAILGTFLPILTGTGLTVLFGYPLFPDGMSVGVSLAPTSVGIALKLLHEAKALQTYFGQAVMTAAFVDDVLSLVIFSALFTLAAGDVSFMAFLPLILGIVFMVLAIIAAVKVWPPVIKAIFDIIPETKPNNKITKHDEVMWVLMFVVLCAYAQITHMCGTHLWGCFIAGMSFATLHHAHHVWVRQVKRVTCWFLRIFFACTLAWSIPIDELFSFDAFWKGTIMGIGPCILTKVCCGPFMGRPRWVIGWAMVGRAEFAYFIAILAKSLKMMDDSLFAILIWSLIYATIFAPLIFRKVLQRYMIAQALEAGLEAPKFNDAFRQSGHLPDIEQEEVEEAAKEFEHEYDEVKAKLHDKEDELYRMKSGEDVAGKLSKASSNGGADSTDSNFNLPGPEEFDKELKSRDDEIARLKSEIKEARAKKDAKLAAEASPLAPSTSLPVKHVSTKVSL